uniref:Uncharacterized protein n=1 Tax=Tanacetum cinerariifolium TaxID=118510 RepID=A0A6L2MPA5_TANCI|nr:hypothetical protein [Tanacetum cinerariifolium]
MPTKFVTWINHHTWLISQILGVEFLRDLPANNMIRIKGNNINFDAQFTLIPLDAEDDGHGYELNEDFLDIHPMHMYTKALMRHNGYEQMMRVKMKRHSEDPKRTNHVNVFGRWRLLARANGFDYHKLIRFRYMHEVEDLDAENEADKRYLVFQLC